MAKKLFSINRAVEFATLRSKLEGHIFFSTGKVGYIIFSDTLVNVTAVVADAYLAKGYHVGFLTDITDAAHAYACPNATFRAYLRALATPVNNLQKMIAYTSLLISTNIGLTGNIQDFGLHWFVGITRYFHIYTQPTLAGFIPNEISNLILNNATSSLRISGTLVEGEIPKDIGNMIDLTSLQLLSNKLTGLIPEGLGNLTKLTLLSLYSNQLSGSIPRTLGNLINVTQMLMQTNQLSGTIPVELGGLVKMTTLRLDSNNLSDYEQGAISTTQNVLNDVNVSKQSGESAFSGLPSIAVDKIIIDMADNVLVNNQLNGTLNVSGNFAPSAVSVTDAIARFGNISAKAFLESKGWTVTHS